MKKLDLSILENADGELLEQLSDLCRENSSAEKVWKMTEKKYGNSFSDDLNYELSVVSAEKKHRILWRRVLSYASALILVSAVCTGGILALKGHGNQQNEFADEFTEETTETDAEETTVETTPPVTETEEKIYRELELHLDYIPVIEDEFIRLNPEYCYEHDVYNRIGVNRAIYMEKLLSADADNISDLTNKSYIYHMMANSIDYYDAASGKAWYDTSITEFTTNIPEQTATDKRWSTIDPDFYSEDIYYKDMPPEERLNPDGNMVYCFRNTPTYDICPKDNYRYYIYNGESFAESRTDWTNLDMSSNIIFPQEYVNSRLCDFSKWDIVGITEYLGRTCAVLEGTFGVNSFTVHVDIETGIQMLCTEIKPNGEYNLNCGLYELELTVRED